MAKPKVLKALSDLKTAVAESGSGGQISAKFIAEKSVQKGMGVVVNANGKVEPATSQYIIPNLIDNSGTTITHTQALFNKINTIEVSPGKYLMLNNTGYKYEATVVEVDVTSLAQTTTLSMGATVPGEAKLFKVRDNKFVFLEMRVTSRSNNDGGTTYTHTIHHGVIEVNGLLCNMSHRGSTGFSVQTSSNGVHDPAILQLDTDNFLVVLMNASVVFKFIEGTGTLEISRARATMPTAGVYPNGSGGRDQQSFIQRIGNLVFYSHNYYNSSIYSYNIDSANNLSGILTYPMGIGQLSGFYKIDDSRFLVYTNTNATKSSKVVMVTVPPGGPPTFSPEVSIGAYIKDVAVIGNTMFFNTVQGLNMAIFKLEAGTNKLTVIETTNVTPAIAASDNVNDANYVIGMKGERLVLITFNNITNNYSSSFTAYISDPFILDSPILGITTAAKSAGAEVEVTTGGIIEGLSGLEASKYYRTKGGVLMKQERKDHEGKSVGLAVSSSKLLIL